MWRAPRNPNGRTVAISPRHRQFIQDAGCRRTWGASSPRKRPLPELLPGSPQPLSVLPGVAVAARPPTRQDRPRCPCSKNAASVLLREVPLNRYPSQIRRRAGIFGSSSSILTPQPRQRARLPPCPLCGRHRDGVKVSTPPAYRFPSLHHHGLLLASSLFEVIGTGAVGSLGWNSTTAASTVGTSW